MRFLKRWKWTITYVVVVATTLPIMLWWNYNLLKAVL